MKKKRLLDESERKNEKKGNSPAAAVAAREEVPGREEDEAAYCSACSLVAGREVAEIKAFGGAAEAAPAVVATTQPPPVREPLRAPPLRVPGLEELAALLACLPAEALTPCSSGAATVLLSESGGSGGRGSGLVFRSPRRAHKVPPGTR